MLSGTCLCGVLAYEVAAGAYTLTHCHCSMCRKHHGAAFASFVAVPQAALRWITGEDHALQFVSSESRVRRFCDTCGAVAPVLLGDHYWVPAGNLFGELVPVASEHMFVACKAPWHPIADGLPAYAGPAPGWSTEVPGPESVVLEGATHGSCLCGDVTFAVRGDPARWLQCHCSRCRRARSAAHGCNAFYPLAQFTWRTGQQNLRRYNPPDAKRFATHFCGRCGGGAPVERENVPFVLVPAGLLDGDPGARPQAHIHIASKASWYPVLDGLKQFPELPDA